MRPSRARPRLYAHRGAAAEQPENTVPSFRRAVELGADALELDVHLTADGHIVVSHDPTGARMAGVAAEIRRSTLAEVVGWDAGWGFVDSRGDRPFANRGYTIPTLEEVLVEFPDQLFNIDLKQRLPSMVAPMLRLLQATGATSRVVLASFDIRTLLAVRARGYAGMTALARAEVLSLLLLPRQILRRLPYFGDAAQIPPRVGPLELASRRLIDKCHALDLRVDFWTVNQPDQARALIDLGADGIMTDDPATIAPVLDDYR